MDIYQTLGIFIVILSACIGFAGVVYLAVYGFSVILISGVLDIRQIRAVEIHPEKSKGDVMITDCRPGVVLNGQQ